MLRVCLCSDKSFKLFEKRGFISIIIECGGIYEHDRF